MRDRWYESVYGRWGHYVQGVLAEHVHLAEADGASARVLAGGMAVVVWPDGSTSPVLCGELVRDVTEDGPCEVRCGGRVYGVEGFACPGHESELKGWRDMDEAERADWERQRDREGAL